MGFSTTSSVLRYKLTHHRGHPPLRSVGSLKLQVLRFAQDDIRTANDISVCCYSPERMIGAVGVLEPPAFSMVMPKALAGTPVGSLGSTTEA
jgi:hypothetical protein